MTDKNRKSNNSGDGTDVEDNNIQLEFECMTQADDVDSNTMVVSERNSNQQQSDRQNDQWGVLRNERIGEDFKLIHRFKDGKRDTYLLGRGSSCDVRVNDKRVSSEHCKIYCEYSQGKMRVYLEDSSVNGTYINDSLNRLKRGERMEIKSGYEIFLINPANPNPGDVGTFLFINWIDRIVGSNSIIRAHTKRIPPSPALRGRHIEQHYIIGDQLGFGTCGAVHLCLNIATREECAVKIIDTRKFELSPGLSVMDLREEAEMMSKLDHPNIVQIKDLFETTHTIYIVMELVRGGDLFDRILERRKYSEASARIIMHKTLSAVDYLHQKQIVHRDLKPENILLVDTVNDTEIKITDFGLAKRTNHEGLKTFCGTPQYFAPEVLKRKGSLDKRGRYGQEADMWSIGVILYILLSGSFPFDDNTLFDQIESADYSLLGSDWSSISEEAKHMIRSLLTLDPSERLTAKRALEHPWMLGKSMSSSQSSSQSSFRNSRRPSEDQSLSSSLVCSQEKAESGLKSEANQHSCSLSDSNAPMSPPLFSPKRKGTNPTAPSPSSITSPNNCLQPVDVSTPFSPCFDSSRLVSEAVYGSSSRTNSRDDQDAMGLYEQVLSSWRKDIPATMGSCRSSQSQSGEVSRGSPYSEGASRNRMRRGVPCKLPQPQPQPLFGDDSSSSSRVRTKQRDSHGWNFNDDSPERMSRRCYPSKLKLQKDILFDDISGDEDEEKPLQISKENDVDPAGNNEIKDDAEFVDLERTASVPIVSSQSTPSTISPARPVKDAKGALEHDSPSPERPGFPVSGKSGEGCSQESLSELEIFEDLAPPIRDAEGLDVESAVPPSVMNTGVSDEREAVNTGTELGQYLKRKRSSMGCDSAEVADKQDAKSELKAGKVTRKHSSPRGVKRETSKALDSHRKLRAPRKSLTELFDPSLPFTHIVDRRHYVQSGVSLPAVNLVDPS